MDLKTRRMGDDTGFFQAGRCIRSPGQQAGLVGNPGDFGPTATVENDETILSQ